MLPGRTTGTRHGKLCSTGFAEVEGPLRPMYCTCTLSRLYTVLKVALFLYTLRNSCGFWKAGGPGTGEREQCQRDKGTNIPGNGTPQQLQHRSPQLCLFRTRYITLERHGRYQWRRFQLSSLPKSLLPFFFFFSRGEKDSLPRFPVALFAFPPPPSDFLERPPATAVRTKVGHSEAGWRPRKTQKVALHLPAPRRAFRR